MYLLRPVLVILLAAVVMVACSSAPAAAKVSRKKAMWGPLERNGQPQMPVYAELGVGLWQTQLRWERTAKERPANPRDPADPAYKWPKALDDAIAQGRPFGINVLVMVIGAPPWANGGHDWNFPPTSDRDYADFVEAAAKRYPAVKHWMVWGEPNGHRSYQPVVDDGGRPLPKSKRGHVEFYAKMLDRSYGRLKKLSKKNMVIGGNTWTIGATKPFHWIRALRLPNGKPPRMDLYGHNPFGQPFPSLGGRGKPRQPGIAEFSDLDTLQTAVNKQLRRRKRGKRIRIFVSEYALPTDHQNVWGWFVSREDQARYLRNAMRVARSKKWIYSFGYYTLFDGQPLPDNSQGDWGLLTIDGTRKPAFDVFKNS